MTVPTPDEYARMTWHARQLAATRLTEQMRTTVYEIRQLRAARRGGIRTAPPPVDTLAEARRLWALIEPDPEWVIAERIAAWIGPTRKERNRIAQANRRARQRAAQRGEQAA